VEVQEHDSVEDHQPETLGSREESWDQTNHSSASKNHVVVPYEESSHISVQKSHCILKHSEDRQMNLKHLITAQVLHMINYAHQEFQFQDINMRE